MGYYAKLCGFASNSTNERELGTEKLQDKFLGESTSGLQQNPRRQKITAKP